MTNERNQLLDKIRNQKMSRSAHAYVRGNTARFYEWLETLKVGTLPEGPPIWICGDCHVGNLGPVANSREQIEIQIRDLDQTVIGNPAHDLIRLALSLASAARGSNLPGVITTKMLEEILVGYELAFQPDFDAEIDTDQPRSIRNVTRAANGASWRTLATERIKDPKPTIPLGKKFWPISEAENASLRHLFESEGMHELATMAHSRETTSTVKLVDAAYWVKGCSSLGRMRYAVLLEVRGRQSNDIDYCLMDIKEAVKAAAPRADGAKMPTDQGERVVEGARHLSPFLGKRMTSVKIANKSAFVRELMPQDLKIEIESLTETQALKVAHYLGAIVGKAHSRQMDHHTRTRWQQELKRTQSATLAAPAWMWNSTVELLVEHERAYLEHCRRYMADNC